MNILFIIGMQKSGTSLFNRILMQQKMICNPFLPEGKYFWGDNPPLSPKDKPCGELFQKHQGKLGHHLNASDFRQKDKDLLLERIIKAAVKESIIMNKNPYNSVRIKWLKKIFPNCKIIFIYRQPIPNIYSLLKKHHITDLNNNRLKYNWWGVKPKNWLELINKDKLIQCVNQWNAVNLEVLNNKEDVDMIINYDTICSQSENVISQILSWFDFNAMTTKIPHIKNMNNEYLYGSRIESKNKELRKNNNFDLSSLVEKIEIPPFTNDQISHISNGTSHVWSQLVKSKRNFK